MARKLTELQAATLRAVVRATPEWYRATRNGQRVTLASLYYGGVFERRAHRGREGEPNAAYEYRLAPEFLERITERVAKTPETEPNKSDDG